MWADVIIIVANDVPLSIFRDIEKNDKKKIVKWNIQDYYGNEDKKREDLIRRIKARVEVLLKEIS